VKDGVTTEAAESITMQQQGPHMFITNETKVDEESEVVFNS
jgi:hypothetical protein